MKYILTDNGIEVIEHDTEVSIKSAMMWYKTTKVSDTIEELCDCFIVIRPLSKWTDHYILYSFSFAKEHCFNGDETVYGAIWTDKGLIYVAKMNEKGDLVLL